MPANDNVTVRIVGDASQVQPAVEMTEASLASMGEVIVALQAQTAALTAAMSEGFASVNASVESLRGGIKKVHSDLNDAKGGLLGFIGSVHQGAESVRTFQMRAKEFAEVYVALFAVDRVAEFINKMGEAAEKVMHLSQQFGMSIAEVQQLQGVATATGIPIEALTKGMGFLDRNMANAAMGARNTKQAMDAVGISFNDGRTQMEKLAVVADKFKDMDDGPKKAALAMQLFGRSGRELIPVLNLGKDGIEQLNQKMQEYGVVNDDAVAKGAVLAETVNETKLGFAGMENVLTSALAPAFTKLVEGANELIQAFIQSYQQGGIVAVIFATISDAIKITVAVVEALGSIFRAIWSVIVQVVTDIWRNVEQVFGIQIPKNVNVSKLVMLELKNVIEILKDGIILFVDSAGAAFEALGKVIITFDKIAYDALHLDWASIQSDWNAGMQGVANIVHAAAGKIEADAKAMGDAIAAAAAGKAAPGTESTGGGLKLPKAGGDFDFNPTAKGKKDKKPKDDAVQQLEEELQAKKNAWNEMQVAQDTAQEFSLQSEADFWKAALARTDLSAKDKVKIEQKYIAAEMALQKEAFDAKLELDKEAVVRAGQNAELKGTALKKEAADIAAFYGAQSKEAVAANKAVVAAEQEAAKQLREIRQQEAENYRQSQLAGVALAEANAKFEVEMGRMSQGQLIQLQRQYENERYQIDQAALQQRLQLMEKDPSINPVELKKLQGQIEQLERQHQAKLTQLEQQGALQRTQIERNAINSFASSWASALSKLATLQAGFATTLKSLWQGVQQAIGGAIEQLLQKFIAAELTKIIYVKATAQATIAGEAAKAGAGGIASMAAAPWPLDMSAPAFGASMSAAAMAFSGLNSAEGGAWSVQEGLYHLHENELVLPAWAATGLRGMVGGAPAPANFNAPASADGGGGNHTFIFNGPVNKAEMKRWFIDNHEAVGAGVRHFVRQNGNTGK